MGLFNIEDKISVEKANAMNPIVLAFIGDAVYTLYVREKLSFNSDAKSGELNKLSSAIVNASSQAKLITKLMPILTEEEIAIFKRARNAKKGTRAKSSTVSEYNMSTGFEGLIGYLYVTGNEKRINYLLNYEGE